MAGGNQVRTDVRDGHIGLAVTIVALVVVAIASGPRWVLIVAGAVAAWFVLALIVVHARGGRGSEGVARVYVATFGWGDYISP
jgi:hypothetical protein